MIASIIARAVIVVGAGIFCAKATIGRVNSDVTRVWAFLVQGNMILFVVKVFSELLNEWASERSLMKKVFVPDDRNNIVKLINDSSA